MQRGQLGSAFRPLPAAASGWVDTAALRFLWVGPSNRSNAIASSSASSATAVGAGVPRRRTPCGIALRNKPLHQKSLLTRTWAASNRVDHPDGVELSRARSALSEAQRQIELLTQQVDGASQLEHHMLMQDKVVQKLQEELQDSVELQGAGSGLGLGDEEQQPGAAEPPRSPLACQAMLEAKEEELLRERQRISEARQRASEVDREAQDATVEAADAAALLAKQQRELATLEAELSRVTAGGSGKAGSSGRGFGPKKGKKGSGGELLQLQLQATALKQAVDQAQLELEEQRRLLAQCEEEAAAANDSLERLGASSKDQAVQVATVTAELLQLRQQLVQQSVAEQQEEEALAARLQAAEAAAAAQVVEAAARLEQLRRQLSESEQARASLQEEAERRRGDTAQLHVKVHELQEETASLRAASEATEAQAQALRGALEESRQHPLDLLELQVKEVSVGIETVFSLRSDLQVLADAFQAKEAEAERLQAAAQGVAAQQEEASRQLEEARERELEVQLEAQGVLQQVLQLKELVAELQYSNSKLAAQNQELQSSIRAQDRVTRTVESKTTEMEGSLVGFSDNIVMLRSQLELKTQALEEASEKLAVALAEEKQACLTAEALADQVEVQRKSALLQVGEVEMLSKELQFSRNEVEKLRRAQVLLQSSSEAVAQRQSDVLGLREAARAAEEGRQQLHIQLDMSMGEETERQAEKQALEERHNAELSASLQLLEALTHDLELLQAQGARSKALDQKQQDLVQAQVQVDQLRSAIAQQEELLTEALDKEDRMHEELSSLHLKVETVSRELESSREDLRAWGEMAAQSAQQLGLAREAGAEMQLQLVLEAQATQELLAQAERLLLATPGEGGPPLGGRERPSGSPAGAAANRAGAEPLDAAPGPEVEAEAQRVLDLEEEAALLKAAIVKLQEQAAQQPPLVLRRDVAAAESRAAAVQAESEALRERVKQLESVIRCEQGHAQELKTLPLHSLTAKVEALEEENRELKQLTRRQERLLKQTRKFLQGQA